MEMIVEGWKRRNGVDSSRFLIRTDLGGRLNEFRLISFSYLAEKPEKTVNERIDAQMTFNPIAPKQNG